MALHFTRAEFGARLDRARARMAEQGLDALLLFRQESMYYLSGYDTEGFVLFQTMVVGADGRLALLTRSADREQAAATSIVDDVRIWVDRAGANPGNDVRDMLASLKLAGKRIGVEYDAYCLTARRGKMLEAALEGFCTLVDASDLVRLLRVVKSPAELKYVRKAGALANAALRQAVRRTRPGVFEGDIYAAMLAPIL
ncbi:MAG: aminopeptidase P family N-terminal domain-containing protein, partial [Alphaproteobacteria bacterium]